MHTTRLAKRVALTLSVTITTAAIALGAVLAQMPDTTPPTQANPVAQQTVSDDLANEDTSDQACWYEKAESLDTAELICGDRGLRPTGAVDWYQLHDGEVPEAVWRYALRHGAPSDPSDGCECLYVPVGTAFGPVGQVWVATVDGMEPAGTV